MNFVKLEKTLNNFLEESITDDTYKKICRFINYEDGVQSSLNNVEALINFLTSQDNVEAQRCAEILKDLKYIITVNKDRYEIGKSIKSFIKEVSKDSNVLLETIKGETLHFHKKDYKSYLTLKDGKVVRVYEK